MLVNVEVNPNALSDFKEFFKIDANGSRGEDECHRFDVLRNPTDPHKFIFYEVYKDADAHAKHKTFEHFKVWDTFA